MAGGIRNLPSNLSADLALLLRQLKESHEQLAGHHGAPGKRAVLVEELESLGLASLHGRTLHRAEQPSSDSHPNPGPAPGSPPTVPDPGQPVKPPPDEWTGVPPPPPTNLVAVASYFYITLTWDNPYIGDYSATEVWASLTNDRSTAVFVDDAAGTAYSFTQWNNAPIVGGTMYYFWVRNRDTEGLYSDFCPATTTGVSATVSLDPTQMLGILYNSITNDQLSMELRSRINGGLDAAVAYQFDSSVEGWTAVNGSLTWQSDGTVWLSSSGTDPMLRSPSGLAINGGLYPLIRVRVKRTAGSAWDGTVYYSTGSHGETTPYRCTLPDPGLVIGADWTELTWDMHNLTEGADDWKNSTIIQFRIDLGASSADAFLIDWIAVGRLAPGGSQLQIKALNDQYTVKIDNDGWVTGYGLASTLVNGVPFSEFQFRGDRFVIGRPGTPADGAKVIVSSLTRTGTTATATVPSGHGLSVGDWVGLMDVDTAGWNGSYIITESNATTVKFIVAGWVGSPASPVPGQSMTLVRKDNLPLVVTTTDQTYSYTDANGQTKFVTITPGVYINRATIASATIMEQHVQDGAISNLKIGNVIQSNTWSDTGNSGWKIDKSGNIIVKGGSFQLYDANGDPVFLSGDMKRLLGNQNLLKNSAFETFYDGTPGGYGQPYGGPASWYLYPYATHSTSAGCVQDTRRGVSQSFLWYPGTAFIYQPNDVLTGADYFVQENIPVEPNLWYEASVYTGVINCNLEFWVDWRNSSGTLISTSYGVRNDGEKAGGDNINAFKRLFVIAQAPANAAYARFVIAKYGTNYGTYSFAYLARAKFAVAYSATQQQPTPWTRDTAVPWISGQNIGTFIESAAITAAYIKAAEIGTLHVAGNAITVPESAYVGTTQYLDVPPANAYGAYLDAVTLAIATVDMAVKRIVFVSFQFNHADSDPGILEVALDVNGSIVFLGAINADPRIAVGGDSKQKYTITYPLDTSANTSYMLKLKIRLGSGGSAVWGGSPNVTSAHLIVFTGKR